jgi:hypothetical protein
MWATASSGAELLEGSSRTAFSHEPHPVGQPALRPRTTRHDHSDRTDSKGTHRAAGPMATLRKQGVEFGCGRVRRLTRLVGR